MEGYSAFEKLEIKVLIDDASTKYRILKYGGSALVYQINCHHCRIKMFTYQKDGDGPLLRCYADRILCKNALVYTAEEELQCSNCFTIISKPKNVYSKNDVHYKHSEERYAFELIIPDSGKQ